MKLLCHCIKESIYMDVLNLDYFKDVCVGASFSVQITEVFPGIGYQNSKVCPVKHKTRSDSEDFLTESLQSSYTYGLNERKRKADPNLPAGCSLPPIPRSRQRSARC